MNKLQRYVIIRRYGGGQIDVIGTNSGQAFVENAAKKTADRLRDTGGSFHIVEITKLFDYLAEHGNGTSKVKNDVQNGRREGDGGRGDDSQPPS